MRRSGLVALAIVALAACSDSGARSAQLTGPTDPQVIVTCLNDPSGAAVGSGNTTITANVDCGDRPVVTVGGGATQ